MEIQQIIFNSTNLICENLWYLRHLRAFDPPSNQATCPAELIPELRLLHT